MISTACCKLWLLVVGSMFLFVDGGIFFEQKIAEILVKDISKRWTESSPISCLLECIRNGDCHMAALTNSECLFLKSGNISKGEGEKLKVRLLKKIESPNNSSGILFFLLYIEMSIRFLSWFYLRI